MSVSQPHATNGDDLATYLNDHWGGAAAGRSLARRMRRGSTPDSWRTELTWLEDQIAADERTLGEIRTRLGVEGGRFKRPLGVVSERLALFKLNGRTPLSRVLQAETLMGGVMAKQCLWAALRSGLPADHAVTLEFDFQALEKRGEQQLDLLRNFHERAAAEAFAAR